MTAVWPFIPQKNVVESIEWLTDILKCKKVEYRLCLRAIPRVIYSCKYQLDDGDYGVARELARSVGGDPVFVPDWPTATQIPTISPSTVSLPVDVTHAPAYRVGGSALIWTGNSTHEVVTVTALGTGTISISATVNGYATPWVIPLRLGTFSQEFSGDRGPQTYSTCAAVFTCIDTEDLSGASGGLSYPTYLADDQSVAIPVVTDPVYIINNVQEKNTREVETLDSQTGPLVKYALFSTPNQSAVLAWFVADAPSLWALRVWLHTRRGRWKQFWTSSWNADVTVTKDITAGDGSIQIAAIGFASKYPIPCDMGFMSVTGGFFALRVTGVSAGPTGNELLNFTGAYSGSTWSVASILKASKLTLSRLDADRVEIQHLPGRQASVAVPTKEVPVYP